ncbi:MAG TPA: DUF2339 domain-containing protein, partial [Methylomirabilota bacterium]
MLLALLSLLVAAVALVLGVILPIVSWGRMKGLERELRLLRERIAVLEERQRTGTAARAVSPAPPGPAPTTAPPDAREARPPEAVADVPGGGMTGPPPSPGGVPAPPAMPPGPLLIPPPPPRARAAAADAEETGLEEAIGGRLMLWVGAIVLVLGVGFFLKYAFDNAWITETTRVALGVVAGLALVAVGHGFARRGFAFYGQIVAGGGLAVLYLSIFAAFSFYALIGRSTAFALLLAVTIGAAALADRQRSIGLAVMAVGGGFITPFVVGGDENAQLTLFSYDALLVAGTMALARRHDWPALNALSFVATWLTIGAWADTHYTSDLWLRTELFLTLFAALFVWLLRENVRRRGPWDNVSVVLASGPLIYHFSSLAILGDQGVTLPIYLIAVTVAGVGLSVRADSVAWRVVTWALTIPPLLEWIGAHQTERWLPASLVTAAAMCALHAHAQIDRVFR